MLSINDKATAVSDTAFHSELIREAFPRNRYGGAGTTGLVADRLQRNAILIELNPAYAEMARNRLSADAGMFAEVA